MTRNKDSLLSITRKWKMSNEEAEELIKESYNERKMVNNKRHFERISELRLM